MKQLDKIIQDHIKISLTNFLNTINIIHTQHHGGRKLHSAMTVLACLIDTLKTNLNNHLCTTNLQTEMSVDCDTIEHTIRLSKLEHYSVRNGELNLNKS